ncbi:MAG TPA: response regulator transcription factor [Dehalococcoidia bacterium]|nr:response regulator transcription factor [Dehalococcoidia bacterium]
MPHRILVVDDDPNTTRLVRLYLQRDGHVVSTAADGLEALQIAREKHPDLIVLDIMMPKMDGVELCRVLRQESDVPIIMLTARTTDEDKLKGLDTGADDYVTKPFSPRELAARVRAVLRRLPGERGPNELHRGDLVIDFRRHDAFRNGTTLGLTRAEFKLLGVLALQPGRVFSREQLIEKALGHDFEGYERTVDAHIRNIRRKIEDDPAHPSYIRTVYGAGYSFVETE